MHETVTWVLVITALFITACVVGHFVSSFFTKGYLRHVEKKLKETKEELDKEVRRRLTAEQQLAERFSGSKESKAFIENQRKVVDNIIEDLKADRDKILAEKLRYEALLASINDGVVAVDRNSKIILMNRRADELLGVKTEHATGKKFSSVCTLERADGIVPEKKLPLLLAMKSGRAVSSSDYILRRSEKKVTYLSMSAAPITFERKHIGAIAVFRDVSKEKLADKAKTEFVSLASHQLRTPLSAISWNAEMLLNGDIGDLSTEQKGVVESIDEGTHRMIELVNSLLNVSRIELGTFTVNPEPVQLVDIIEKVLKEHAPLLQNKQIRIVKKFSKRFPVMPLDPKLMFILVQNLVNNAAKYMPPKGTITISIARAKNVFKLTVADTGYGIPKNDQPRVFDKLYRADNAKKVDSSGTGLGLYIIKSILDQVGGRIWFDSVENKGTTFHVELPLGGMKQRAGTKALS